MPLVMAQVGQLESYAWALSFALQVGLIVLLIFRRNYATLPTFTLYVAGSVVQNIADFLIYQRYGYDSPAAFQSAWGLQFAVIVLRAAAVLEICRLVFANYRGIWAFIWRTLVIGLGLVALLSMILSERGFEYVFLYADRAAGLSLAVAIVALMVFARYYQVQASDTLRSLAIGFFLSASFVVLNDTLLETLKKGYDPLWNFLGTVSYIGSVLVWGWALRRTMELPATAGEMLPASIYRELSPDVNRRLSALNERLSNLTKRREQR